ncbi:MAG: hypothetical protein AAGF01_07325 [Cyanobacteria bacterium P01_G01_bin.38]
MAYSDFSLVAVKDVFGLVLNESTSLFAEVAEVAPSDFLTQALSEYLSLATSIGTEKARSEFLIAPVLAEVRRQLKHQVALFSGTEFNVDKEKGLYGFCDFLMCRSKEQLFISAPVMTLVEAKKEDIIGGLGQCIASMIATQLFNQKQQVTIDVSYGAVITGTNWRFLTLQGNQVKIDATEYYIKEIDKILAILLLLFKQVPTAVVV